jgi:hypothetical protein
MGGKGLIRRWRSRSRQKDSQAAGLAVRAVAQPHAARAFAITRSRAVSLPRQPPAPHRRHAAATQKRTPPPARPRGALAQTHAEKRPAKSPAIAATCVTELYNEPNNKPPFRAFAITRSRAASTAASSSQGLSRPCVGGRRRRAAAQPQSHICFDCQMRLAQVQSTLNGTRGRPRRGGALCGRTRMYASASSTKLRTAVRVLRRRRRAVGPRHPCQRPVPHDCHSPHAPVLPTCTPCSHGRVTHPTTLEVKGAAPPPSAGPSRPSSDIGSPSLAASSATGCARDGAGPPPRSAAPSGPGLPARLVPAAAPVGVSST